MQASESPFVYGGIYQPRDQAEASLCVRLYEAACSTRQDKEKCTRVACEIREALASGRDVLLSEEMLLVDQAILHQAKIRNLASILGDIPVTIVICLRNPLDAVRSLYQELFQSLRLREQLSFTSFLAGNQALIYDYEYLVALLRENAAWVVRPLRFEHLVTGMLSYEDLFGHEGNGMKKLALELKNVGENGGASGRRLVGAVRMPLTSITLRKPERRALEIPRAVGDSLLTKWQRAIGLSPVG